MDYKMVKTRLIVAIFSFVLFSPALLATTYIREYTYKANNLDTEKSSRIRAIDQIKFRLLQEIGTHIHHEITISKKSSGSVYASEDIQVVTAGVTKLKILTEEWDGRSYFLKAEIKIDNKKVVDALDKFVSNNNERNRRLLQSIKENQINLQKYRDEIER